MTFVQSLQCQNLYIAHTVFSIFLQTTRESILWLIQPLDFFWPADRHVQVSHQAIRQRIDPAVNEKVLTARPSILHDDVRRYVDNLADDVELTQTVGASMQVRDRVKLSTVPAADLANGLQPVIHQTAPLAIHRR